MSNDPMDQYHEVLQEDFMSFVERGFYELNPETKFLPI